MARRGFLMLLAALLILPGCGQYPGVRENLAGQRGPDGLGGEPGRGLAARLVETPPGTPATGAAPPGAAPARTAAPAGRAVPPAADRAAATPPG